MNTYRIVETDNFGGDYPNESFVSFFEHRNRVKMQVIADAINAVFSGPSASRHWKVVEMPYTLRPGFEP